MKIFCVGRNYALHASELGSPVPEEPIIFLKPASALLRGGGSLIYPSFTHDLQHEVELVLRIATWGKDIALADAGQYYDAIGVGIDMTARDLQNALKDKGLPWEKCKAFDGSAPVSERFIDIAQFEDVSNLDFRIEKNGQVVQSGNSSNMLFSFDQLISHISGFFTLEPGDLVFTGTPEGVGPVTVGDTLECFVGEQAMLQVEIHGRQPH